MNSPYECFDIGDVWMDLELQELDDGTDWLQPYSNTSLSSSAPAVFDYRPDITSFGGGHQPLYANAGTSWAPQDVARLPSRPTQTLAPVVGNAYHNYRTSGLPPPTTVSIAPNLPKQSSGPPAQSPPLPSRPAIPEQELLRKLFDKLPPRMSNAAPTSPEYDCTLHEQPPRSANDLYTAQWVRGERTTRAGWCGYCCIWYRLKDSAYWYHMNYTHGISSSGTQYQAPLSLRQSMTSSELEGLCPGCNQWILIGRGVRCRTGYYRHAYKCHGKNSKTSSEGNGTRFKSGSPRKAVAKPLLTRDVL
ncbi:hypothetical protein D0869_03173 [Hortaea werneckii]|uniref:Transcription regulator Rua1 C-terminal domain-containing protein n=1 Tax=Hortaea werneckii TaxID=91943 RepID=A0A3M6Y2I5_HORWE|nr:hypothetical protein KC324_g7852 [Hortaea werneckii]KAI7708686.1 hypothetical protein KC353_g10875 [Hortaea werneckii]RMX86318.1 hypothetical protein D0869_03173 [Hortaea werneckii]RMX97247.1 hypothetical protein D0867_12848 [Hortaea werneckii]RMY02037.1 hypothetical protein D0868_08176 [Hortaea werneckii]